MTDQYPVLILVAPFLTAFLVAIVGAFNKRFCLPLVIAALSVSVVSGVGLFMQLVQDGSIPVYKLGAWDPPFGISYNIDQLNAIVLVIIAGVALLTAIYSYRVVEEQTPDKVPLFYTLYLLLVVGLMGMTATGDAFNLYVLLEISSLTSYALIAMGSRRASVACFNYIIMGTIGASFYLLGVGYLYMKTGTLNMADIRVILLENGLYESQTVLIAFIMIMIGVWIKMAFFPLHTWLPNAYTYSPTAAGCLIAPLMTKVSIYIMIRIMMSVFSPAYVFGTLDWGPVVVAAAVVAIVSGSIFALAQVDLKKMLTYLIIAEVGYMVGGVWLANKTGLTGAIYHIAADALMTLCLFLAVGVIYHKMKTLMIKDLNGLFIRMPFTMAAFTVGALSMIGIPPTCGFFSKFYLISGGIEAGQWAYVGALLFSSLINAILFFRFLEFAHFGKLQDTNSHEHGHHHDQKIDEAPLTMLIPLLTVAVSLVLLGVFAGDLVAFISNFVDNIGLG